MFNSHASYGCFTSTNWIQLGILERIQSRSQEKDEAQIETTCHLHSKKMKKWFWSTMIWLCFDQAPSPGLLFPVPCQISVPTWSTKPHMVLLWWDWLSRYLLSRFELNLQHFLPDSHLATVLFGDFTSGKSPCRICSHQIGYYHSMFHSSTLL